ncbi:hypothetical protein SAMN05421852_10761 [Thermoflavimicrobium dichotomicum]|uniref:Uncharacterized protein n=1 Tax=Thermoflavimicrobium dichotomicum TaxID=46223 RepID=A0A1I3Q7Y9_9BACL|nr:hypothetical protein SAMN05421852_10761 [Thermoflavimicrobium dichotomicum]
MVAVIPLTNACGGHWKRRISYLYMDVENLSLTETHFSEVKYCGRQQSDR